MNTPNSTRETRTRLVAEGVVASYIHEISTRSAPRAAAPTVRQVHARRARSAHVRAARRGHVARPRELVALEA